MRIFKQAFDSLKGGKDDIPVDGRPKSNSLSFQVDEQFMTPDFLYQQQQQHSHTDVVKKRIPLQKSFYQTLSALENKFQTASVKPFQLVDQLVGMYQDCVQTYDANQDPIKYYFVDKIKYIIAQAESFSQREPKERQTPKKNQQINPDISYFREFEDFTERIDKPTEYSTPRADNTPELQFGVRQEEDPMMNKLRMLIEEGKNEMKLNPKCHTDHKPKEIHHEHHHQLQNLAELKLIEQKLELQQKAAEISDTPKPIELSKPTVDKSGGDTFIATQLQSQQQQIQARLALRQSQKMQRTKKE